MHFSGNRIKLSLSMYIYVVLLRQKHLRGGGGLYIEIDRTIDALLGYQN